MKKFLLPMLLAIAVLISSFQVQAAGIGDVPDFRDVAGYDVTDGERVNTHKGYRIYSYSCPIEDDDNFASDYVEYLIDWGLTQIGHDYKDFRRTSAQSVEKWFFTCRGQRVEFWQYNYYNEGRISFSVRVANGLTYAGN